MPSPLGKAFEVWRIANSNLLRYLQKNDPY